MLGFNVQINFSIMFTFKRQKSTEYGIYLTLLQEFD